MSEPNGNGRRGINFDPTINLGHIATGFVFLASTMAAWITLNSRVEQQGKDIIRVENASLSVENRLMTRINEEKAARDQDRANMAYELRDLKEIVRGGFRDLDAKLDRKADKPGAVR